MTTYPMHKRRGEQEHRAAAQGETAGVHPAGTTREIPPASHPGVPLRDRCFKTIDAATKHGNKVRPESLRAAVRYLHCERIADELTKMAFEAVLNPDVKAAERKTVRRLIEAHRSGVPGFRVLSITLSPADVVAMETQMRERQQRA